MRNMTGSLQEQARELSLALEWGLVDLNHVIRWADEKILECENIADELCDVSLATDVNTALTGLNELARGSGLWLSAARALRRILEIEDLSPRFASTIAMQVYRLGLRKDAPEAYISLMHHWDDIDLAIDGYTGNPEQATRAFVQNVSELVERLHDA